MKNTLNTRLRLLLSMTLLIAVISARAATSDAVRQHGAHEHGVGIVNVAAIGNELLIELEIPAVHVVGFEHPPKSDDERAAVERARRLFEDTRQLFGLPNSSGCTVRYARVQLWGSDDDPKDTGRGHDEHPPQEKHEDEEYRDEHASLNASYAFHCSALAALKVIEVKIFTHLTGARELQVQLVTPSIQTRRTLTPTSADIVFAQ